MNNSFTVAIDESWDSTFYKNLGMGIGMHLNMALAILPQRPTLKGQCAISRVARTGLRNGVPSHLSWLCPWKKVLSDCSCFHHFLQVDLSGFECSQCFSRGFSSNVIISLFSCSRLEYVLPLYPSYVNFLCHLYRSWSPPWSFWECQYCEFHILISPLCHAKLSASCKVRLYLKIY